MKKNYKFPKNVSGAKRIKKDKDVSGLADKTYITDEEKRYKETQEKKLAYINKYDMNNFHALAIDRRTNQIVEMINVYTGECRKLNLWDKLKLIF